MMRNFFIWLIETYQKTPLTSHSKCVFLPTCSEYSKEAFKKYGVFLGLFKTFKRVIRCHPWQKNNYDPL